MTWMAWLTYTTSFFFMMFTVIWPSEIIRTDKVARFGSVDSLGDLCIDNIRTQSWWTYVVCLQRGIIQVHVDPKTKTISDRIQVGEYKPALSSSLSQVYTSNDADCVLVAPDGTTTRQQRTATVSVRCCDVAVHTMRQSRHTGPEKYAGGSSGGGGPYWVAEQVAQEAVQELKATRGQSGYRASPATATAEAYLQGVEESSPCAYEAIICSELACSESLLPAAVAADGDDETKTGNHHHATTDPTGAGSTPVASIPGPILPTPNPNLNLNLAPQLMGTEEQLMLRERARAMFHHAYDSYMNHAYPEAELCPLSCRGGKFDLIKIPLVTLVDTLDTLVILGNHSEFRRAVSLVEQGLPHFAMDVNVSVFETTIRILGGLLSAHLMAVDPHLAIYDEETTYNGALLNMAVDLGDRLLPAFETKTGIPYGTVNLLHGVPQGETKIASTAGAGSLLVEFQVLSLLSGRPQFGQAAYAAAKGLFQRKSSIGLLGKHIHTETGQWVEALSGVGSNADSFYEYLLKAYLLFRNDELFNMFSDTYRAIKRWVMVNERWFTEVDMFSGKLQRRRVENLDAFWPGVEAMLGFTGPGADQLNTFYSVWQDLGFLPEEIEYNQWQAGKGAVNGLYPLRPELIESTYHQYRTTGDRSWLAAGKVFLESIESYTRTSCGYAAVTDVSTMKLADTMPSFFLSETAKYLFLLFDEDNFVNHRPYIFSTEAHPFDAMQIHLWGSGGGEGNSSSRAGPIGASQRVAASDGQNESTPPPKDQKTAAQAGKRRRKAKTEASGGASILDEVKRHQEALQQSLKAGVHTQAVPLQHLQHLVHQQLLVQLQKQQQQPLQALPPVTAAALQTEESRPPLLPMKCRKPRWWDRSASFDAEYLQEANSNLRNEEYKGRSRRALRKNAERRRARYSAKASTALRVPLRLLERPQAPQLSHASFVLFDLFDNLRSHSAPVPVQSPDADSAIPAAPITITISVSKLKWYERPSPWFPRERCYPADKPSHQKGAPKKAGSPAPPPAGTASPEQGQDSAVLKTVRVSMGALGEFVINVYADGFVITSAEDGLQVDISNVGRNLVLVRESSPGGLSTVAMAATDQRTVSTCRVQLISAAASQVAGSAKPPPFVPFFDRPCSVANFGPTAAGDSVQVEAERVLLHPGGGSNYMCRAPGKAGAAGKAGKGAGTGEPGGNWWGSMLQFLGRSDLEGGAQEAPEPAEGVGGGQLPTPLESVALVDRGECLFEDKAANARTAGARAVIVRNNEDAVFIMAGKRDVQDAEDTKTTAALSVVEGGEAGALPVTVMLSKSDGDALAQLLLGQHQQSQDNDKQRGVDAEGGGGGDRVGGARVRVVTEVAHMVLTSELMGDTEYPKVYLQPRQILVVGSGRWATLLKATKGEDWQLYLMSREDVSLTHAALAPPHPVLTAGGHRKDLPHTVLIGPLALYAHTVARKCPRIIRSVSRTEVLV